MAFDHDLSARIRMNLLAMDREFEERRMFGGLCFMVRGHMVVGITGDKTGVDTTGEGKTGGELMVRCGEARAAAALENPHARLCDFTGRIMKSILLVKPDGFDRDEALTHWVSLALDFIETEPPKKPKAPKKRRSAVTKN